MNNALVKRYVTSVAFMVRSNRNLGIPPGNAGLLDPAGIEMYG